MSDDLERIRQELLAEVRRTPPPATWTAEATTLVLVNVGVCAGVLLSVGVTQTQHASLALRWLGAAMLAAVLVGGAWAAVKPRATLLQRAVIVVAAASVPVLLAAASGRGSGRPFLDDWACSAAEVGIALVPGLVTMRILSRFAASGRRTLVGALGASATGLLVLHVACHIGEASHILAFHVAPAVLVALVIVATRARLRSQTYAP